MGKSSCWAASCLLQKDQPPKTSTTPAANQLALPGTPLEQSSETKSKIKSGGGSSFSSQKQIDAGVLTVGYAEAGPADGAPVILSHGWPCGIHSFVDVAPLPALRGRRVIVLCLRGYGLTHFLSSETARNGQQSVVAVDIHRLDGRAENSEGDPRRL